MQDSFSYFVNQLINGVSLGAIYGLIAIGYTMVYGIIGMINFAHGEIFMIGAFIALMAFMLLGMADITWVPLALMIVLLAAMVLTSVYGWSIERVAYRPLRASPRLAPLITAIGVSIILQHLAMMVWSRNVLAFPQILESRTYFVAGAAITNVQIAILLICVAVMAGLATLVYRTRLGTAMRATAQNMPVAGLMGIDVNRVIATTFVIGAGLAAVAGVMVGSYYGVAQYTMGSVLGLKAFAAAVLGGIGNIPGAMLGGVLLGVVEALGAGYIGDLTDLCRYGALAGALGARCEAGGHFILFGSNYQDVFAFVVLILVLVFRPSGLLGERVGDRA